LQGTGVAKELSKRKRDGRTVTAERATRAALSGAASQIPIPWSSRWNPTVPRSVYRLRRDRRIQMSAIHRFLPDEPLGRPFHWERGVLAYFGPVLVLLKPLVLFDSVLVLFWSCFGLFWSCWRLWSVLVPLKTLVCFGPVEDFGRVWYCWVPSDFVEATVYRLPLPEGTYRTQSEDIGRPFRAEKGVILCLVFGLPVDCFPYGTSWKFRGNRSLQYCQYRWCRLPIPENVMEIPRQPVFPFSRISTVRVSSSMGMWPPKDTHRHLSKALGDKINRLIYRLTQWRRKKDFGSQLCLPSFRIFGQLLKV
jgi:hypothetical protein